MSGSFKSDLWEGTAAIYERYSENKAVARDVVSVLTARVAAEERYAKELAAIAAKSAALAEGSSLAAAWLSLRESHAQRAEMHTGLARRLQADVVKVVADDIRERSHRKGELFEEDKNLHAQLNKHRSATESALQRYMAASAAAEVSKKQFHFAQQDASMPPKKLKTMETQESKLSADADKAHDAYKQHLADLNAYQKTYESGLGALLDNLQVMEEERTAKMDQVFNVYLEAHLQLNREEASLNETSAGVVAKIDTKADLENWIQGHASGLQPEALVEYEAYEAQFENAAADELPKPQQAGKQMPKHTLRKTSESPGTSGGGKKLQRQKSLSRLLGNKSKGVSKKGDSVGDVKKTHTTPDAPTISSPTGVTKDTSSSSLPAVSKQVKVVTPPPEPKTATKGRRAKALFEFIASDDTEISFAVGDIVTVVREDDSGWWDCETKDGDLGLAPGNYLQFLDEGTGTPASKSPANSTSKLQSDEDDEPGDTMDSVGMESVSMVPPAQEAPASPRMTKTAAKQPEPEPESAPEDDDEEEAEPLGTVTALYDFAGDGEDELPVKTGDVIEVYAEVEGWYTGTNAAGDYGLLPKNFCSELQPL